MKRGKMDRRSLLKWLGFSTTATTVYGWIWSELPESFIPRNPEKTILAGNIVITRQEVSGMTMPQYEMLLDRKLKNLKSSVLQIIREEWDEANR